MNILILGSGGREHAFAWKIKQSKLCKKLFIAPGNAGTSIEGINVNISVNDFEKQKSFCVAEKINMVIVGPEDPLVNGIYDFYKSDALLKDIIVVGPSKFAAQLEGSKSFAKKFMFRHQIPTAAYQEFDSQNFEEGINYLKNHSLPIVLKADGLAAGKGVIICTSTEEAIVEFTAMIQNQKFGNASAKVVVEQFLDGIEMSVFAITDGKDYVLLPNAKDYKRIGEGDTGLNTGGMGAISPVPFADEAFMQKVITKIIEPTINGFKADNYEYFGFVFFGLIKVQNEPYVIEYNCRMGDPETEVVIPRLQNDMVEIFINMHQHKLNEITIQHLQNHAATTVLVSGGYPVKHTLGMEISGIDMVKQCLVFQAGTTIQNNKIITNGGRVIAITSMADTLHEALQNCNNNANIIDYKNKYYRKDIGWEFI